MTSKKRSADYNGNDDDDDDAAELDPRPLVEYRDRFYEKLEQVRFQLAKVINARYGRRVNPQDFLTPEGRMYWNFRFLQEMKELNRVYGGRGGPHHTVVVDQYLIAMGSNDTWQCGVTEEQGLKLNVSGSNDTLLIRIEPFRNARRIAAGGITSAVLSDGIPYVFGSQDVFQNVDEATTYGPVSLADVKYFPDQGNTLTEEIISIADIAVGDAHMLLLTVEGQVYSTGFYKDNDSGQFIDTQDYRYDAEASNATQAAFHRVTSLDLYHQKVVKIFAGECLSAAILQDGTLVTWGMSNEGSLARSGGMDLSPDSYKIVTENGVKDYNMQIIRDHFMTPQPVRWRGGPQTGRFQVEQVAFGAGHILVLAYDTTTAAHGGPYLYAAGNNSKGQLGTCDDAPEHRELTPARGPLENVDILSIAAGKDFSLAVTVDGNVFSFGGNDYSQLGIGSFNENVGDLRKEPQPVLLMSPAPVKAVKVAAGSRFAFCLTDDGDLYSWGDNDSGETGHPKRTVPNMDSALEVSFPTPLDLTTRFQSMLQIPTNECIKVLDVVAGSNHAILLVRNEKTMG